MCEYSLHDVCSRPAKVSDKLVTTEFASARGFAAVGEHGAKLVIHDSPPKIAVCLLPGTELTFDDEVRYDRAFSLFGQAHVNHKVARFRQIDMDDRHVQHDALEFPNGQVLKLTELAAGQTATVLQLPVAIEHARHVETENVARLSGSRIALNRAFTAATASIMIPNQGAVMLWQTIRTTAIRLSTALTESFRGLKARKRHLMAADGEKIETGFKQILLAATLSKTPATHKEEKQTEANTAA